MRDYLLDIVQHTNGLGVFNTIKVIGTTTSTSINAFDQENKSVILNAEFKAPIADFLGTFGMPNLDRLNTILNIPEYKEDAVIQVTKDKKDDSGQPLVTGIEFKNKNGDFKNYYRFMSENVINDQLKSVRPAREIKWNVDFVPSVNSIRKLKFQSQAHSDATSFSTATEKGYLKIYFGDHSSHAGDFVFAENCGGSLARPMFWPVAVVNSILSLPGDKTFKISDAGVAEIAVDSGLAVYKYMLPAQSK
jgi:hypothetical protein